MLFYDSKLRKAFVFNEFKSEFALQSLQTRPIEIIQNWVTPN